MSSFVALFATVWILGALFQTIKICLRVRGIRKVTAVLGGLFVITGGIGFFGAALSSSGVIPTRFEWPLGRADQIFDLPDGRHVALHTPTGRIQVYDSAWHFERAWNVDAGGGDFKAKLTPSGMIEVWTARGEKRFLFTPDGRIVESGTYVSSDYSAFREDGGPGFVPTFWPLLVFSHPFISWGVVVAGSLLLVFSDPERLQLMARARQAAQRFGKYF